MAVSSVSVCFIVFDCTFIIEDLLSLNFLVIERDAADAHRLPRGAEQDFERRSLNEAEPRREALGEGGLEKTATVYHERNLWFTQRIGCSVS